MCVCMLKLSFVYAVLVSYVCMHAKDVFRVCCTCVLAKHGYLCVHAKNGFRVYCTFKLYYVCTSDQNTAMTSFRVFIFLSCKAKDILQCGIHDVDVQNAMSIITCGVTMTLSRRT